MMASKVVRLKSGYDMPLSGLGLWKVPNEVCADLVYGAIKVGYRLFDTAPDYGNEYEAGDGINRAIDEGLVKREDLFVVSKLWNTFHKPDYVKPALERSLYDMRLDYVDMYMTHYPVALRYKDGNKIHYPTGWLHDFNGAINMEPDDTVTYEQTWGAMEDLVDEGLVGSLGSCNIGMLKVADILKFSTKPLSAIQVEMHPFLTQENLLKFCNRSGV